MFAAMLNAPGFDALLSSELGRTVTLAEIDELRAFFLRKLKAKPASDEKADNWDAIVLPSEIDAVLALLQIPIEKSAHAMLSRAAIRRETGEDLRLRHVLSALVEDQASGQRSPTSPSAMLSQARTFNPQPISSGSSADVRVNPSDPLRLSSAVESLLRRGLRTQREIFLNPALGTKGLVAGILTTPQEERTAEFTSQNIDFDGIDFDEMQGRFRDVVRERFADNPEEMREWFRALELETATLPKLNHDQPGQGQAHDKLGITNDALAIANVAAGSNTNLPLAFGIFGDWGAGKTFFMRLIQDQIAGFVKSEARNDGFEHAIVQIEFNAWHYAETNLWASLVGHIFDELDRWMTRENRDPTAADQILQRLATSRQLTLEAAAELAMRRKEHAKAESKLSKAQESLANAQVAVAHAPGLAWRVALDAVRQEIMKDAELEQQLGTIGTAAGVPKLLDDKAKLVAALDELNRSASAGNAMLGALRSTVGSSSTVILALSALVVVPLLLFGLHTVLAAVPGWSGLAGVGSGFEALGGLLAMLAVLAQRFSNKAKSLADKFANLKRSVDVQIALATQKEQDEVVAAASGLAKSSAEVENAKTLAQATGDQVVAALKDYAEETSALRIRRFVRARAGADGYGKHLGLVSTIRKDFEQLESLMLNKEAPPHMEEARLHYEARVKALIKENEQALEESEKTQLLATATSPRGIKGLESMRFNRIVLYIDDLDRCEPDKVVEILQAVNMLLSFRLFVVMVAVDARWLSRSLEKRYPDFFGRTEVTDEDPREPTAATKATPNATGKVGGQANRNEDGAAERATAADYLEKIFQIPYWVPSMNAKASISLVGDLVAPDRIIEKPGPVPPEPVPAPPDKRGRKGEVPAQPALPEEDRQTRSEAAPSRALGLTDNEIATLTALSPFLGGSPRRARRFVNIYRVAKASLTPAEVKKLEDGEHRALATQLAIATGAPNAFGTWMSICERADEKRLTELVTDEFDRSNIEGALKAFRAMPGEGTDVLARLAVQASRAARFSFAVPRRRSQGEASRAK
ncbi:P-loop NTPase fold protein [Mesorhizobium sp. LjNodule214]|uniref:P-loop NTPase fold protein n=1 Tax=Mesorhizobium sp. LjNodule214 TaxID=3342252 RepID=UPI003ED11940